ncbi:MAG: NADH-quinone oxidoreductase subunit M, partial [Pseudomonadota bacterium]
GNKKVERLEDLNFREAVTLGSLAVAVLGFGIWPEPLVELMHVSVDNLLTHVAQSKIQVQL